jgi:hypothetical protein
MKTAVLAAALAAVVLAAAFAIELPGAVTPGSPLAGTVEGESERSLALEPVELRASGGGVVASTRLFRLRGLVYGFVLGIPADTPPGTYVVRSGGEEATVEIAARDFRRERIRLDVGLSDLLSREDQARDAENAWLERLLTGFDPGAARRLSSFRMPVTDFRRSSPFGEIREYALADGGAVYGVHRGVDLALPEGARVEAPAPGRAVFAAPRILTGNSVVLEHLPGVYSLYFHLSVLSVAAGQVVAAGDLLGLVGSTGLATGPHLHWEVRVSQVPVDPEAFVAGDGIPATVDRGRRTAIIRSSASIQEGR